MAKPPSGVSTRGIGLELLRLRTERKVGVRAVGAALGISGNTISRIENGKREPTSEEVASILTFLGVTGYDRERLIDQARRQAEPGLLEDTTATEQSRNFRNFEQKATQLVDFQLLGVPGLGQTVEYAHARLSAVRVGDTDDDIEPWVAQRMGRQSILTRKKPPRLHWILTELGLRQPIG